MGRSPSPSPGKINSAYTDLDTVWPWINDEEDGSDHGGAVRRDRGGAIEGKNGGNAREAEKEKGREHLSPQRFSGENTRPAVMREDTRRQRRFVGDGRDGRSLVVDDE
ncbi:hypothetical protein GUJ93_ZPchr0001g32257 [Zizania palustris]|uniref:Uncharacterized protein n=1 Tax=Zizania palustris TaxID=103762 RepID=A0A8J5RN05_ZIZPA|nr:hypothetical protein GUJ93_ZPchr0001g32257 [Zizania palustris]